MLLLIHAHFAGYIWSNLLKSLLNSSIFRVFVLNQPASHSKAEFVLLLIEPPNSLTASVQRLK